MPEGAGHPALIAQRLLQLPEHSHLREGEATIEWLFRADPKVQAGRQILGTCYMPTVQGSLRDFFLWMLERLFGHLPDFLIVLDKGYWDTCGDRRREILVYHELLHAVQARDKYDAPKFDKSGRPVWALKGHDVEEFSATVRRYGAWNEDIEEFVAAANEGGFA
ncbi:putative metallopeptidase [Paraburkholderia phenoliruptrix]|uniref:putative metallopeptidase n=1 Tax=Paraburkholderia phenoliruptrix TaxID=252970 RepID=UPI0034CE0B6E